MCVTLLTGRIYHGDKLFGKSQGKNMFLKTIMSKNNVVFFNILPPDN